MFTTNKANSNPPPVISPESRSKSLKPGFHVPYEYDDEDSDDDISREVSVEIVMAPAREVLTSSSRPASSYAGVEVVPSAKCSSRSEVLQASHPDLSENFLAQHKTQAEERLRDVCDLTTATDGPKSITTQQTTKTSGRHDQNSVSKVTGSSQANPINLECAQPDKLHEIISDSDDEPPESLPTSQASLKPRPTPFAADPFRYYTAVVDPAASTAAAKTDVPKENATSEAMIADSDIETSDADYGYSTSEDDLGPTSEVESPCTDEHNWSEENFTEDDDMEASIKAANETFLNRVKPQPPTITMSGHTSVLKGPEILVEDSQLPVQPQIRVSTAGTLDGSQDVTANTMQWTKPIHRAPSPSDAALARAPYARTFQTDPPEICSFTHHVVPPAVIPRLQSRDNGSQGGDGSPSRIPTPWLHSTAPPSGPYQSLSAQEYFENMDRDLPLYDDGPFSGWSFTAADQVGNNNASNFTTSSLKADMPMDIFGYRPVNDHSETGHGSEHENVVPFMEYRYMQGPVHDNASADRLQRLAEVYYGKSSKLPISDIVNNAPSQPDEPMRNLKRKADEMTAVESEELSGREAQPTVDTQSSQGSHFPDAQSREDYATAYLGLDETILQPTQVQQEVTTSFSPLSRDEEPARKRAKTTRKSSKPIRAFMSGVLVGCISLAGACAAFIATIPETIKDEALRDF